MDSNYSLYDKYSIISNERREEMERQIEKRREAQRRRQRQAEIDEELSRKAKDDYGDDILNCLLETEVGHLISEALAKLKHQQLRTLPDVHTMDTQPEIQWYMRPYLIDFLIEAHAAFRLLPGTLFLAVNLLDRYCSKRTVYRRHYQLVGCTALLIASKYVECAKKVPRIKELAHMCCELYDEDLFVEMERHVMVTIEWFVGAPTIDSFLEIALEEGKHCPEVEHMALYLSEIAMFQREFVATRPSEMAKAAITLARIVLGKQQSMVLSWPVQCGSNTLVALSRHIHRPSQILHRKYQSAYASQVAIVVDQFVAKHAAIARAKQAATFTFSAPLTPPSDVPSPSMQHMFVNSGSFQTPRKNQFSLPNGCLTPPITPDIETFTGYGANIGKRDVPASPTPNTSSGFNQPQFVMSGASLVPATYQLPAVQYTEI